MTEETFVGAMRLVSLLVATAAVCMALTEAANLLWPSHYHPPGPPPNCHGSGVKSSVLDRFDGYDSEVVVCNDGTILTHAF